MATPRRTALQIPKARILLVDDHAPNLVALEAILESLGQDLVLAHSGEEALKALLSTDFALILLDVQMPGLDGFQTASIIRGRDRTRHIPIIFLTAHSKESSSVFRGYRTGAVDFLVKPFDPDILRSKVSVFVELYIAKEQLRQQGELLLEKERATYARQSAERLQSLVDVMPQCVWAARPDGTIYMINTVWRQYTGLSLEETANGGYERITHPDDREEVMSRWHDALRTRTPFETEFRLKRADSDDYRWFLGRAVPEMENGEVIGWIGTATDIDEHKHTQFELRLANDAKDTFIAAASHELRTPLAAAKAQSQLLLRRITEDADPRLRNGLATIARQIERMARLIDDLLDVSRIQSDRLSLEIEPFDLETRLREDCERVQTLSTKHEIELQVAGPLLMAGDRDRLDQVVTNLLTNAIRYSPDGGTILVRAELLGNEVHLSVTDRGLGIPKEKQSRIFERFTRAHGSKYGGLGLGLTIAYGIVEQHGGRIWVESTGVAGEGSTFHVMLPREPERRSLPEHVAPHALNA